MPAENSQPRELKPEQKIAAHTLDCHLSVTAGPGAGKTFVLVERYLEILRTKKVSVDNIVAITFTNRAANEMRQRVRARIDAILRDTSPKERQTWLRHKRTLEGAVITTIHGFCSRLLHEFPVEANIDPQFVLLDEHQSMMLIESVVEEALADAIHHGNETILQYTQGVGRAALAQSLIELHRKYRDEGLSLDHVERLTAAHHASRAMYDDVFAQLDAAMRDLLSVRGLSKGAADKKAKAAREWPALRAILAEPPNEKTIARYVQAIEDFWEVRPRKGTHPAFDRIDEPLWGDKPGVSDCLRGRLPAIGFDLLAKKYSLSLLKLLSETERRLDAEKQRLSVLDFDDLQLRALRLLDHPEVLVRVSERYRYFLVDEFQDTNGLQRDLLCKIALIRGTNLFIVGDRKQSVYGFRGADVDVFAEMSSAIQTAGGQTQPLSLNFRSQKPLIDSFNFLFAKIFQARSEIPREAFGELGFVEHEPSESIRGAEHDPPLVELLVSVPRGGPPEPDDSEASLPASALTAHERDAEQVAARILELTSNTGLSLWANDGVSEARPSGRAGLDTAPSSGPSPGRFQCRDIAILLRAFTGVWTYEAALRRAGIPYLTVQGKGFYQREEITDLVQLLRFLDNTTDELALAAVLRSPLAGISDNTLLALRCAPWVAEDSHGERLHRRNLLRALRRHREIQFIDDAEHVALDRVAAWLELLIEKRHRYGIADLLRDAVNSSEFTTVIAANFDGAQRIANVEKLFRLAEQFERTGFLIRDFVHYVEEFEAIGGREGEGQMDETANVVRLMTIHQAKGLEFPVVIIPDLHRDAYQRNPSFVLDRHKGVTVRIPDGRGRSVRGEFFNDLSRRNRWREEFESMRLLYVAATRARDRLILTGAVEQKELANLTKTESEKWLAWIWQALELPENAPTGVVQFGEHAQFQITIDRESFPRPMARIHAHNAGDNPASSVRTVREMFPLLHPVVPEMGHGLRRMTVTQLINFQRCPRQYYFERMLRTPGAEERAVWNDAEAPEPPANLTATLKGAVIHRFCETFSAGDDPEARLAASFDDLVSQRQAELAGRTFDIDRTEAVRALLPLAQHYLKSDVFRRVTAAQQMVPPASVGEFGASDHRLKSVPHSQSAPGVWSELRFRLRRRLGILTGTIDKLLVTPAADGDGVDVEIIDFKTNRFPPVITKQVVRSVATMRTDSSSAPVAIPLGQGAFNFEAVTEEVVVTSEVVEETPSTLEAQIQAVAEDYRLQMQAYALALRELIGVRVGNRSNQPVSTRSDSDGIESLVAREIKINSLKATLHFLDPNVEVTLTAALLDEDSCAKAIDEAMTTIASLDGTLDADQFPPLPATHCRICNFRDMCPAGREWLRDSSPNQFANSH
jgi:ATP-dependent helicase/nuclease subunit A